MGFSLKVVEGTGEGQEYSFEQGEARLGRTADNDVVVKDAAASRSHAKVSQKGAKYFVEDLGSANGTELNGAPLKSPRELKSGDSIGIGDVVLRFTAADETLAAPSSTVDDAADEAPVDTTIPPDRTLERPAPVLPPRRPSSAARPKVPARAEPEAEEPEAPEAPGDEAAESLDDGEDAGGSTRNFKVPPPQALARKPPAAPAPRGSRPLPPAPSGGGEEQLSAAERMRMRRELRGSAGGKLQLAWIELPRPARIVLTGFALVVVVLGVGLGVYSAIPKRRVTRKEPVELVANDSPMPESFGSGDVTFDTSDMKTFNFETSSPTRVVGVLHYQAANISKDEVALSVNGADLGTVPPDNLDPETRELDQVVPATQIKQREQNTITFDNVLNPPADDPWKIWNVWLEIVPVPEMSAEEAARRSREEMEKAAKFYETKDVGSENLFRAWKTYREAWLLLETTPERPQELLLLARTRLREIRPELDRRCSAMLVEYKKAITLKPPSIDKARAVLKDIPTHFPTREHPCNSFSKALLQDLEDWGPPVGSE